MKGFYFAQINPDDNKLGAVKKVHDQVEAFSKSGFDIELECEPPINNGLRSSFFGKGLLASVPFLPVFSKYKHKQEYLCSDFYYFRFLAADYHFIRFLRWLKKNNGGAKVFVEFPTYPTTHWMKSVFHIPLIIKDVVARRKYKGLVDWFVVTRSDLKELYGVPVIPLKNGIDVDRIPIRTPSINPDNEIHVIGVATMFPFHGYDRFLKGMGRYYNSSKSKKRIVLHLVGQGPGKELPRYKQIALREHIEPFVIFEGEKQGEELDSIFNKCSLALCSLGMFRHGLDMASSLKTREYLARGIPLVSGCAIDVLEGTDFAYELRFRNDESIIDINEVVNFYERVYQDKSENEVIMEIREFAREHCDVSALMKCVFDCI